MALIRYKKVFDSVDTAPAQEAQKDHGMEETYSSRLYARMHRQNNPLQEEFPTRKGARQGEAKVVDSLSGGDVVSRNLDWVKSGITVHGKHYLSHSRSADDIVLFTESGETPAKKMLQDMHSL